MLRENMEEKYEGITTYKIGEVASRADVNKETVRYYEKRGLIPEPDRRRSGYRIFTQRHIDQIRFIKRAQELGFTLSEIKELRLDADTDRSEIREEAQKKYQDVIDKIEKLERIRKMLTELIDSCSGKGAKEDCPILGALKGENKH